MLSPADRLECVSNLYSDIHVLTQSLPADATIWCAGKRKPDLIRRLRLQKPQLRPVLLGTDRSALFLERDLLRDIPSMGFLRNLDHAGWSNGLPYPVQAASLAFCLSALPDAARVSCIAELALKMPQDGILIWSDFFLPQTLDLQSYYLAEYAHLATEEDVTSFEESFVAEHPNPVLLETAINEVYRGGFANAEIISKRLGIAVLVAQK